MLVSEFRRLWRAIWPNVDPPADELWSLIWKPLVERADQKDVTRFFREHRAKHERGQWPPEPNVFAKALDLIKKPKPSGQRGETAYACDWCEAKITGTLAMDKHLEENHAAEILQGTEAGKKLIGDWLKSRRKDRDATG